MLRAQLDRVADRFAAADEPPEGIVLEAVGRQRGLAILNAAMPQLANCTLGIVGIFRILVSIIIRFPNQPVKVVIGVGDGLVVAVGGLLQVAASTGFIGVIIILVIDIGRERPTADLGRSRLPPCVIREVIILVLLRAVAEGLAVEGRQAAVGIAIVDVGDSAAEGAVGAQRGGVVGVCGQLPLCVRYRRQLAVAVVGVLRRVAAGIGHRGGVVLVRRRCCRGFHVQARPGSRQLRAGHIACGIVDRR